MKELRRAPADIGETPVKELDYASSPGASSTTVHGDLIGI